MSSGGNVPRCFGRFNEVLKQIGLKALYICRHCSFYKECVDKVFSSKRR